MKVASSAEIIALMAASKAAWLAEYMQPGEVYAGIVLGTNGESDYHLFLRPEEAEPGPWEKMMDWAANIGYALPNRRELRLLWVNCAEHFKTDRYYWSCEQHAGNSGGAWIQYFGSGNQGWDGKSLDYRARAIRRLPIQ